MGVKVRQLADGDYKVKFYYWYTLSSEEKE